MISSSWVIRVGDQSPSHSIWADVVEKQNGIDKSNKLNTKQIQNPIFTIIALFNLNLLISK